MLLFTVYYKLAEKPSNIIDIRH